MLYHIVTLAKNHVIGKNGELPWNFEEERHYFLKITAGSTVIMGRKTYQNLGKPLPGRENFVLSKSHPAGGENPCYFRSLGDALGAARTKDVFIGGGAELFRQTLSFADGVYMIRINADYEGDAFYPPLPESFAERSRVVLREDPRVEAIFYENVSEKGCSCHPKAMRHEN